MKAENRNPDQSMGRHDMTQVRRPRRPILLKIAFLVFVLWTVLGWLRFAGAMAQQSLIGAFFPSGTFMYLITAGLIWGLVGLPVLWGLVVRAGWTVKLIWITGLLYPSLYWFERIILWQNPGAQDNWPFMLLLTLSWVGLLIWVSRSKRVRVFFGLQSVENEGC